MPENEPDYRLMRRVAIGEEEAVAELYDRFSALVFKLSLQFLSNKAEAEDAVQEIFVRLWKTADRFDPRKAKLVTWCRDIWGGDPPPGHGNGMLLYDPENPQVRFTLSLLIYYFDLLIDKI